MQTCERTVLRMSIIDESNSVVGGTRRNGAWSVVTSRPVTALTLGTVAISAGIALAGSQPRTSSLNSAASSVGQTYSNEWSSGDPSQTRDENFAFAHIRTRAGAGEVRREVFGFNGEVIGIGVDFENGVVSAFTNNQAPLQGRLTVSDRPGGLAVTIRSANESGAVGRLNFAVGREGGVHVSGNLPSVAVNETLTNDVTTNVRLVSSDEDDGLSYGKTDDGETVQCGAYTALCQGSEFANDVVDETSEKAMRCVEGSLVGVLADALDDEEKGSKWSKLKKAAKGMAKEVGKGGSLGLAVECAHDMAR